MSGIPFKKNNIFMKYIFKIIILLFTAYLGWIFVSASLDKIIDPHQFSKSISNYQITPYWINNLVALILPWVELICGILMFVAIYLLFYQKSNFIDIPNNMIIAMLLWFIFILSIAVYRGLDIDCGCGVGEDISPAERLIEDIYLLMFSIIIKFRLRIAQFFK